MNTALIHEIVRREIAPRALSVPCTACEEIPVQWLDIQPSFNLIKMLEGYSPETDFAYVLTDSAMGVKQVPIDGAWAKTAVAMTCGGCKSTFWYTLENLGMLDQFKRIAHILAQISEIKAEDRIEKNREAEK